MDSTHHQDGGIAHPQPLIGTKDEVASPPTAEKSMPHVDETGGWQPNRSEVAAFLQQWDLEMEAMQRGLHGIAMTARHDFILQRMGGLIDEKKIEAMWQTMRAEQNASSTGTTKQPYLATSWCLWMNSISALHTLFVSKGAGSILELQRCCCSVAEECGGI